jgi:hypothetical protein
MRLERDGFSIDQAIAKGRALPEWFLEEPIILPGEEFYIKAFFHLSTCRHGNGMSTGPIPWNNCLEYGLLAGLDNDIIETFIEIIRVMDTIYLKWQDDEAKKAQQSAKRSSKAKSTRK